MGLFWVFFFTIIVTIAIVITMDMANLKCCFFFLFDVCHTLAAMANFRSREAAGGFRFQFPEARVCK